MLYYAEDFNNFDTDTFDQAAQTLVQTLCDTLQRQSMYISRGKHSQRPSVALVEAVKDKLPWLVDNNKRPNNSCEPTPEPAAPEKAPATAEPPTHTESKADNYTRELTNLAKLYTDKDQYSGQTINSFEYKLTIFQSKCKKAGIPPLIQN